MSCLVGKENILEESIVPRFVKRWISPRLKMRGLFWVERVITLRNEGIPPSKGKGGESSSLDLKVHPLIQSKRNFLLFGK